MTSPLLPEPKLAAECDIGMRHAWEIQVFFDEQHVVLITITQTGKVAIEQVWDGQRTVGVLNG